MRRTLPIALLCGLAVAACGSSSAATTSTSKAYSQGLKFSQCMRSHGVPNFPDPIVSGNGFGIRIGAGTGVNPQSPSFQAAQRACSKLLPGGGPETGHPSKQAMAQMLTIAECMRAHGVSGFPDPTTTPPSSPAGFSLVLGRGGAFLALPRTLDVASPAFKQAAATCGFGPGGKPGSSAP